MEKEFYLKLKLEGVEYNALELEQLIFRAIMLENPRLPYDLFKDLKNDITVAPIEYFWKNSEVILNRVIAVWLKFERSEIDELDIAREICDILKPIYWDDLKDKN